MSKDLKTQTPGEVPQTPPETVEAVQEGSDSVTVSKAELAALVAKAVSEAVASTPRTVSKAAKEANLPDQSTVDPKKIGRPVLTKQGWVVPNGFGSNPNQPK